MRKQFKIDKWEYDIQEALQNGYGFTLWIYRGGKVVYTQSGFGAESSAEAHAKKYIIENQFNIELD